MRRGLLLVGVALPLLAAAVFGLWPHGGRTLDTVLDDVMPVASAADGKLVVQDAWPGVQFAIPIAVAAPRDGSDRIFVVERAGRILVARKFHGGQPVPAPTVFLDIRQLQIQGEALEQGHGGLVNMAFPPNYAQTGQFVVFYGTGTGTPADPHRAVLATYRASAANPNVADPASARILLTIKKEGAIHFGGGLAFGADGMLYVGLGDSGSRDDPARLGQDPRVLEAKILRIDINSTSPGLPYGLPKDNPWPSTPDRARPEIFAYGVRNPFRISVDRESKGMGTLWMGDLGQKRREEVSVVPRAGNMGWAMMEADLPLAPGAKPTDYVAPVFAYGREMGSCVIGGVVYRGQRCPALVGKYVFGDNSSTQESDANKTGRVFALPQSAGRVTGGVESVADAEDIVSIDEDAQGELYFSCLATGRVTTLVPAP